MEKEGFLTLTFGGDPQVGSHHLQGVCLHSQLVTLDTFIIQRLLHGDHSRSVVNGKHIWKPAKTREFSEMQKQGFSISKGFILGMTQSKQVIFILSPELMDLCPFHFPSAA